MSNLSGRASKFIDFFAGKSFTIVRVMHSFTASAQERNVKEQSDVKLHSNSGVGEPQHDDISWNDVMSAREKAPKDWSLLEAPVVASQPRTNSVLTSIMQMYSSLSRPFRLTERKRRYFSNPDCKECSPC